MAEEQKSSGNESIRQARQERLAEVLYWSDHHYVPGQPTPFNEISQPKRAVYLRASGAALQFFDVEPWPDSIPRYRLPEADEANAERLAKAVLLIDYPHFRISDFSLSTIAQYQRHATLHLRALDAAFAEPAEKSGLTCPTCGKGKRPAGPQVCSNAFHLPEKDERCSDGCVCERCGFSLPPLPTVANNATVPCPATNGDNPCEHLAGHDGPHSQGALAWGDEPVPEPSSFNDILDSEARFNSPTTPYRGPMPSTDSTSSMPPMRRPVDSTVILRSATDAQLSTLLEARKNLHAFEDWLKGNVQLDGFSVRWNYGCSLPGYESVRRAVEKVAAERWDDLIADARRMLQRKAEEAENAILRGAA